MYRFLDISLIICFSVSIMFVGVESMSGIPPPKNLNFKWETPFRLYLTWDKPEDLEPECKVNYTISRSFSQNCSFDVTDNKRILSNKILLNVSNVNGLCISVTTNFENCGGRHVPPKIITIPPPPVLLVKNFSFNFEHFHNQLRCIWRPAVDVKNLSFYYWYERIDSPIRCIPDEMMKMGGCVINDTSLKDIVHRIFFLFNGTYNGTVVNNTFMGGPPRDYVKLKKPQLTILRIGDSLRFKTNASDLDESCKDCYEYSYTVSKECNKQVYTFPSTSKSMYDQLYDPSCKYRAQVQIIFSKYYGKGFSDLSDEVEYGENSDPNLPALLALIIIPLVVSCCLILFLVLLRRNKDVLFPKIPDPSLFFKEMLISNVSMAESLRPDSAVNRLYVPIEETVEHKISLEQDTLIVRNTTNVP